MGVKGEMMGAGERVEEQRESQWEEGEQVGGREQDRELEEEPLCRVKISERLLGRRLIEWGCFSIRGIFI